jgi:hypothetical protein
MIFHPIPLKDCEALLKDQEDILTPAWEKFRRDAALQTCPSCGAGDPILILDTRKPFASGEILPRYHARCSACGMDYTLWTRLAIGVPTPSRVC